MSPFLQVHVEQDALGRAALMRGNHVLIAKDILYGIAEAIEAPAARIALVAFHDRGPLVRGHSARAGIRQQVNEDIVRREKKQIVVRGAQ